MPSGPDGSSGLVGRTTGGPDFARAHGCEARPHRLYPENIPGQGAEDHRPGRRPGRLHSVSAKDRSGPLPIALKRLRPEC